MGPFEDAHRCGDYDLLLGKRTYDIFAAYWPYNQDNPIGAKFQRINKYVLTHSDEPLEWENSHKLSGETADAVAELKRSEGRDLLIQGSSTLYPPLLAAGLIDRLVADDLPGRARARASASSTGRRSRGALKLVDHFVSDNGVVFATYEPAGEVPTGTFATKEPSEAELERREKMEDRQPGEPPALRPPVQQLHAEGADRAVGRRDAVRLSDDRPGIRRIWRS